MADRQRGRNRPRLFRGNGTWADAVALALYEAGHQVSVVNPALIRAFGQSQPKRTKTDKADAQLIARFCQMHQPPLWNPPAPEIRELQALVRRLETLEEMRLMEENRLQSGVNCQAVRADLEEHVAELQKRIEKTRQQIKDHIDQHPNLKDKAKLLDSIPGIGEATAALLLAELGDISHFDNARRVAAFAGLVPRIGESGSSVPSKPRFSKSLQGGVVTSAQSDVFPGHDSVALQSPHQGSGATTFGCG